MIIQLHHFIIMPARKRLSSESHPHSTPNKRLISHKEFLTRLQNCPKCSDVLRKARPSQIECLIECLHNVVHNRVPLHKYEKRKLLRHMSDITTIAKLRDSKAAKKAFIQTGDGFLPLLIPALIELARSLL